MKYYFQLLQDLLLIIGGEEIILHCYLEGQQMCVPLLKFSVLHRSMFSGVLPMTLRRESNFSG